MEPATADARSVGLLSIDHRVARPLVLLAHSGLLRGWLGARVLESRDRRPFKETFLCLRKKKKRARMRPEALRHISPWASSHGPVSYGLRVERPLGCGIVGWGWGWAQGMDMTVPL